MLEEQYDSYDAIPSGWQHLYRQSGEVYVLIKAGEVKTVEDVNRVQEGLRKEREDHKATKKALAGFAGLDAEEVLEKLDRIEELESANGGKIDEAKINEMVETRLKSKTAPLERQIASLTTANSELETSVGEFKGKDRQRKIHDHIRASAVKTNIRPTAMEDALLVAGNVFDIDELGNVVTKDGVGVTPGIGPDIWLTEVKTTRPHWWPESEGTGANGGKGGGGGVNPFTAENWNMTEQGKLVNSDRSKAEQMAKSAGTTIGGKKPAPKK